MPVFYGEYDTDGSIKQDVVVCAMTGTIIEAGDAMLDLPDGKHFVRVKANTVAHLEGRFKAQWDEVLAGAPSASVKAVAKESKG